MQMQILGKTGLKVSIIGFGAATLGNEYGDIDTVTGTRAVHAAIDAGINLFDTSPYYGRTLSETRLGEALVGKRDQVIIATKCGRYDRELPDGFDFSADRITRSVEESLTRLKTDVIDVFQLHDVEFTQKRQIIDESLPALSKLREQGKIRYFGITGFPVHLLHEIAAAVNESNPVDTVLSYCHYNLLNTTLMDRLTPFAVANNIGLINASVLHMGALTPQGAQDWHPAPAEVHAAASKAHALAESHRAKLTDIALQFALSNDDVSSTLVGMRTPEEVAQNVAVAGVAPDAGLLAEIQAALAPVKDRSWPSGLPENYEPGVR